MVNVLLGSIKSGRLLRLPYLGYSLLLVLLVFLFGIGIALSIGAGEHLMGGDLDQAQEKLRAWFTLPFFIIASVFFVLIAFAGLNIMAKRIRDTGLPGWWGVLTVIVVSGVVSAAVSQQAGSGLHTVVWILLLLIPTNTFAR